MKKFSCLDFFELAGKPTLEAAFPGTHSKHANIEAGVSLVFNPYMTGETFSHCRHTQS
ncbi:hypothetical protein O9992_24475 [Vibrio lentus]|nr:hypothetical protein [Vibrio lentus]